MSPASSSARGSQHDFCCRPSPVAVAAVRVAAPPRRQSPINWHGRGGVAFVALMAVRAVAARAASLDPGWVAFVALKASATRLLLREHTASVAGSTGAGSGAGAPAKTLQRRKATDRSPE